MLGYRVGEMCEQKSMIFAKLGNRILSDQWIDVGLYLIRDYKMCLSEMIKRNEQYNTPQYNPELIDELEIVICKIIETHLRLSSEGDLHKRKENFIQLMLNLGTILKLKETRLHKIKICNTPRLSCS